MPIQVVSRLTPEQVRQEVMGFARRHVDDWDDWLTTPAEHRARKFGVILRKWQATRPCRMRRTRDEARHSPPYLEELIEQAQPHLELSEDVTLSTIADMGSVQRDALCRLWQIFEQLSVERPAMCVGITKAVLLLTDGRIGPAFDSQVRTRLGIGHIRDPKEWIAHLAEISLDLRGFACKYGVSVHEAVPLEFRHLEEGRVYDMVLGPRESKAWRRR